MGQFSTRPEEPTEWAGLPSEPARARPAAESLDAPVESADSLTVWGSAIESVVIPLDLRSDAPRTDDDSEDEPKAQ